jgi:hypothetical protein
VLEVAVIDERDCAIGLRIDVGEQDFHSLLRESGGEIDCGRGLPHTSLLICYCDLNASQNGLPAAKVALV